MGNKAKNLRKTIKDFEGDFETFETFVGYLVLVLLLTILGHLVFMGPPYSVVGGAFLLLMALFFIQQTFFPDD